MAPSRTGGRSRAVGLTVVALLVVAGLLVTSAAPGALAANVRPAAAPPRTASGGADPAIPIALRPVHFAETGLPNGTAWSVALDGQVMSGTGTTLTFNQPASGIPYRFWVLPVAGGTYVPDPPSGTLLVTGAAITEGINFTLPASNESAVIFTEAGLPRNISWTIAMNGSNWTSSNASVQVWLPNGTYNYTVLPVVGFNASPANGTLAVAGRGVLATLSFAPVSAPRQILFHQTGLSNGTNWSLVVNSTAVWGSGPVLALNASPGLYGWSVPATGTSVPSPDNGSFLANVTIGSVTNVTIAFGVASVPVFPVTFSETGLPNGSSWSVTLNGATGTGPGDRTFNESNGSYPYTVAAVGSYRPAPANGTVAVSGVATSVAVTFTNTTGPSGPKNYTVTFQATGLKAGANWSVKLGARTNYSTTDQITFSAPNGTYTFTATAPGYSSAPHTGTVVVNGPSSVVAPVMISFTPSSSNGGGGGATYLVKFVATGLPTGTNWSVVLNGVHQSAVTNTMDFMEGNGTLAFTIGPVAGYSANTTGGNVNVRGSNSTVFVTFSSPSSGSPTNFFSKIPAWGWAVIGLLVVILIIGVLLVMTRRPPAAPTTPPRP